MTFSVCLHSGTIANEIAMTAPRTDNSSVHHRSPGTQTATVVCQGYTHADEDRNQGEWYLLQIYS